MWHVLHIIFSIYAQLMCKHMFALHTWKETIKINNIKTFIEILVILLLFIRKANDGLNKYWIMFCLNVTRQLCNDHRQYSIWEAQTWEKSRLTPIEQKNIKRKVLQLIFTVIWTFDSSTIMTRMLNQSFHFCTNIRSVKN